MEKSQKTDIRDRVEAHDHRVFCDGGAAPLGHPRVYLEFGNKAEITCPYCSRSFVYRH